MFGQLPAGLAYGYKKLAITTSERELLITVLVFNSQLPQDWPLSAIRCIFTKDLNVSTMKLAKHRPHPLHLETMQLSNLFSKPLLTRNGKRQKVLYLSERKARHSKAEHSKAMQSKVMKLVKRFSIPHHPLSWNSSPP